MGKSAYNVVTELPSVAEIKSILERAKVAATVDAEELGMVLLNSDEIFQEVDLTKLDIPNHIEKEERSSEDLNMDSNMNVEDRAE